MRQIEQSLDELLASLAPLEADWQDTMSQRIVAAIQALPAREEYGREDVAALLSGDFEVGMAVAQLFLGLSKDELRTRLPNAGWTRFRQDREGLLNDLEALGLMAAMTAVVTRPVTWRDLLMERLRLGRGRAVRGQSRGRALEDFVEEVVRRVFGPDGYEPRCTFTGVEGRSAKADFAIPSRVRPRIVIEVKGYGATGSKQTDVLGDLQAIVAAKRPDTTLLVVTDGVTWRQRVNDLRKIVAMQHGGQVARIYTRKMTTAMEEDLVTLRHEHGLVEPLSDTGSATPSAR